MGFKYINRPRGGSYRAFDSDVVTWQSAVVANGGSVSLSRLIIVDQFVFAEKQAGNWALTDDYWGLWAENSAQALTSLKQRRLATTVNSPVFTADRGFQGDGATSYINTGFVPSSHSTAMGINSVRLTGYERTSAGGSGATAGLNATTNRAIHIRSAGASVAANSSGLSTFTLASTTGLIAVSRRAATLTDVYSFKNGLSQTKTGDTSAIGTSLPDQALYVGCLNNGGTAAIFRGTQIGFVSIGASLNDLQEINNFNNVQAWATAIGAQI